MLADWESDLLEYSLSHPEVRVIDSVHGIRTLRNRGTMLTVLKGNDIIIQVSARFDRQKLLDAILCLISYP